MIDSNRLYKLKTVAVHLALLRTGKILLFSGDHENIDDWRKGESSLWDPKNTDVQDDPLLERNLFCSGHCFLPDGRLFVAGGQSTFNSIGTILLSYPLILQLYLKIRGREAADHDIHTYDPDSALEPDPNRDPNLMPEPDKRWKRHLPGMPKARWYPTCITLPDGKALIVSGTYSHAHHSLFGCMNLDYEIFDPINDELAKPEKFIENIKMYPFLQVLPGGTLFVHSEDTTKFWNIAEKNFIDNAEFHTNSLGTRTYPGMGSCVLLPLEPDSDTAKILIVGGSMLMSPNKNTDATDVAEIFEFNPKAPTESAGWRKTKHRTNIQRFMSDSILLPDGTVLVTNGAAKGEADNNQVAVREIELFDPSNETWEVIAYLKRDRLYHGSAILLPDGQVAVAGSTGHNWVRAVFNPREHFEQNIEIITPPKLQCNPTRPKISNVPPSISYNTSFDVTKSDSKKIKTVSLIKASSTTHNNNMDQRCIVLPIKEQTKDTLKLSSPKDSTYAPPGYYMLFLLNNKKIPSIGEFVKVG